jgi:intein/homing endonuclease
MPEFQKKLGLSIKQSNLCLTGDTLVQIEVNDAAKTVRLDEVISLFNEGNDVKIKSKNINTENEEYKQITAGALTAKNAQLMLIEDEETGKSIRCTPEHKIYTKNRGYVMAKDLREDDILDIS